MEEDKMLKPLADRVVLKLSEEKEHTVGGFVLAGASKEATKQADVVAVGTGIRTLNGNVIEPTVKVGDRVIVEAFSGVEVKEADETFVIVHESDILAIIEA